MENLEKKTDDEINQFIQEAIKMFSKFEDEKKIHEALHTDEDLGSPDRIEYFNEGELFFEKRNIFK